MNADTEAIRTYFTKLGLETEIADIYLALHAYGPQTILELSRSAHVERTRIYRLLDKLRETNLIEVESRSRRGVIKAAPIANLNILINQREQELKSLQDELSLVEQVLARNSLSSPATRIQFYEGAEGAKQMLWNQTKAKTEILSILLEDMQIKATSAFFERLVNTSNESGLQFRSIFGDEFIRSKKKWYTGYTRERLENWEERYIDRDTLAISHSTIMYNDVVGYFNWRDGEIFGTEIHNPEIAHSQRQLFELLWQKAHL